MANATFIPASSMGMTLVSIALAAPLLGLGAALVLRSDAEEVQAIDTLPEHAPDDLRDTGLYADWTGKRVADDVLVYSPQYPLWTDGARKARWIRLPPGTAIDASDPDAWEFPAGTQLWKEFAFEGRRVETRYMQRRADGSWLYATYVWSADESTARLSATTGGVAVGVDVELGGGRRHAIPSSADCRACHDDVAPVLGFSALQLSSDRDPDAPHAEPLPTGAIDLRGLLSVGLVRDWPAGIDLAPRIAARTPVERAARGYLHGNCGGCHRDDGPIAALDMDLAWSVADASDDDAPIVATSVGRPSRAPLPSGREGAPLRIVAGDPDHSVLLGRMRSRAPIHQMPPLGTSVVDDDAVALIARWIDELDERPSAPRKRTNR